MCNCPARLAAGTVHSLVGKLRAIFHKLGRGGSWDPIHMTGNPVADKEVQLYVTAIKLEQSIAHVVPKKATPLFSDKLRLIVEHLKKAMEDPANNYVDKLIMARDKAILLLQFAAGDRAGDLLLTITQELHFADSKQAVILNHTQGKTLRGDSQKVVHACAIPGSPLCPVAATSEYLLLAEASGIDLSAGFLFRNITATGIVLDERLPDSSWYSKFKSYLKTLDIDDGETPHSLRAGLAITLAMTGAAKSQKQVMQHVGWKTPAIAEAYMGLDAMDVTPSAQALAKAMQTHPSGGQSEADRAATLYADRINTKNVNPFVTSKTQEYS